MKLGSVTQKRPKLFFKESVQSLKVRKNTKLQLKYKKKAKMYNLWSNMFWAWKPNFD